MNAKTSKNKKFYRSIPYNVRGISKEQIFNRVSHKNKVIEIIKKIREDMKFDVIAYCIMDNHLHVLIKWDETSLEH